MASDEKPDRTGIVALIESKHDDKEYERLNWEGTFEDYLHLVRENPKITRNAFQRVYDMIMSYGTASYTDVKKDITHYKFFDDPDCGGADAIFGLDVPLMRLMRFFKSAAEGHDTRKRVLLLHGPVGSSKSTIARLIKRGLERYSRRDEGALYTLEWEGDKESKLEGLVCDMHEEPLKAVPGEHRKEVFAALSNKEFNVNVEGDLCPACTFMYEELARKYNGRWSEIIKHIKVKRILMSEKKRIGIGTFQPKDEKNQDSTELTGDINYRKMAQYGADSDPRAFNFDGEFNISNRGMVEFIEILKLDVAFLYDLLGATQEHSIKPKKFSQTDVDEVIIGHTNEPDYRRLMANEFMEALKDRTIKVDIPYITKVTEEIRIYEKSYGGKKADGKKGAMHFAPHTLEMAAQWVVLTRLEEPKKQDLSLMQKMKLYAGQAVAGYTEDHIKELRKESVREGFNGISPRYIQDQLANALVSEKCSGCVNPFLLLNEIEAGLKGHPLIKAEEERKRLAGLVKVVKQEYEDIVKNEVQLAISADPDGLKNLYGNYIDHVRAYTQREKMRNKYTGQYEEPDERLMRSIEEKIDIPDSRKKEFRVEIMNFIGSKAVDGKTVTYNTNERLQKALELKLFEDKKDSIKLATLVSNVIDKETQEKVDIVKKRMIDQYGYCDICATDVLNFVASIFARGDAKDK